LAHNDIHVAVGGYAGPGPAIKGEPKQIEGASGDMGENDTAAFDPIFYFHHCNIDRIFWIWQKKHNQTDELDYILHYPGTNSSDSQGATPGFAPNAWIDFDTPLHPFTKAENGKERPYISRDLFNIEKQCGVTYSKGSLEDITIVHDEEPCRKLFICNVNKAAVKGSFVVEASLVTPKGDFFLGARSILSRWNVKNCVNCQKQLEVRLFFDVPKEVEAVEQAQTSIQVRNHDSFMQQKSILEEMKSKIRAEFIGHQEAKAGIITQ